MEKAAAWRADRSPPSRTPMRKLFSLTGVLPLGAFLLIHLWVTAALLSSREVYDGQVSRLHSGAFLGLLEVVFVLLPLAFHGGYGLWLATRPREAEHAYESDLLRLLERISGVVVLVFIAWHVWDTRGQTWTAGVAVSSYSTRLVERLSTVTWGLPLVAMGYLVGIAATLVHLVNGLSSFCVTWGLASAEQPRRHARLVFRAGGLLFFVIASATVLQLATGTRFFPAEDRSTNVVCGSAAPLPPPLTTRPARSAPSASPSAAP